MFACAFVSPSLCLSPSVSLCLSPSVSLCLPPSVSLSVSICLSICCVGYVFVFDLSLSVSLLITGIIYRCVRNAVDSATSKQ